MTGCLDDLIRNRKRPAWNMCRRCGRDCSGQKSGFARWYCSDFCRFSSHLPPGSFAERNACWIWQGHMLEDGYGGFVMPGLEQSAHRSSYRIFLGDIPKGMQVCHICDVPSCVNPNHLFLGTTQDNTADMMRKNRGNRRACAKLREDDVKLIRSERKPDAFYADMFGVSEGAVRFARIGKTWANVE